MNAATHDQIVETAKRVFAMKELSVPVVINVGRGMYRLIAGEQARHKAQMAYEMTCGVYSGRKFDRRRWKRVGRRAYEAQLRALDATG